MHDQVLGGGLNGSPHRGVKRTHLAPTKLRCTVVDNQVQVVDVPYKTSLIQNEFIKNNKAKMDRIRKTINFTPVHTAAAAVDWVRYCIFFSLTKLSRLSPRDHCPLS
jgi:hypothetical protein